MMAPDERIYYGYTLIDLVKVNSKTLSSSLSFGSKKELSRRLVMIRDFSENRKMSKYIGLSLAGILALSCLSAPIVNADEAIKPLFTEQISKYTANSYFEDINKFNTGEINRESFLVADVGNKEERVDTEDFATAHEKGVLGQWPVDSNRISSPFGERIHPILKTKKMHTGIDLPAKEGTEVYAIYAGKVVWSGTLGGYGKTLMIDHGGGIISVYAQCSELLVVEDDVVDQGHVIGKVGQTGFSTGPHLHFEIRVDGDYVDPMDYLESVESDA